MADTDKRWVVMECLHAYRVAHGHPGEQKLQISPLMTKPEALAALAKYEAQRPNADFSICMLRDNWANTSK